MGMDRELTPQEIRRKKNKWIITGIIALLAFIIGIWLLRISLNTSVDKSSITTSVVETGDVENTISASGEIVPEFEQEITSPINAVIKSALLDAGIKVEAGQAIMELDKEYTQIELEKLKYELELKKNNITKIKLQLDKSYYDLKANDSIKQLRINSFEAAVQYAKRLYKAGGGTSGTETSGVQRLTCGGAIAAQRERSGNIMKKPRDRLIGW